jgi:hypothetical protein
VLATPAEEFAVGRSLTELVLGLIDLVTTTSKHPLEDASEMLVQ